MSDLVTTIFGDIPREMLEVHEEIVEDFRARAVATVWRLKDDFMVEGKFKEFTFTFQDGQPDKVVLSVKGELARRDAHVMAKTGVQAVGAQGQLT